MENWDYTDFTALLRAYSVYSRTQCMLGNFITHTLAQFDKERSAALKIRDKLMTLKKSRNICKELKTLEKLRFPVRPKGKVTVRTSKPLTT